MARSAFYRQRWRMPATAPVSAPPSSTTRRWSRLADCATQFEAARQLTWHAASLRDAGCPADVGCHGCYAARWPIFCSAALQTLGGYGYVNDLPVERRIATCGPLIMKARSDA
jgi:alkylation response protein AidB-like acyl-CoA dehydrogenase